MNNTIKAILIIFGGVVAAVSLVLGISHFTDTHAIIAICQVVVLIGVLGVLYIVVLNVKHWLDCREE